MLPENNGRFCLNCQKKVIDFSVMSDNELIHVLSKAGESCCGRFQTSQLDRLITPPAQPSRTFFPAALLATLLAATISENGKAQQVVSIATSVPAIPDIHIPECIDGRIIDDATGEGVRGVSVILKGSSAGSMSDHTGYFRFHFPTYKPEALPVFKISCIGYDTREITLDSSLTFPDMISLTRTMNNLREVNVVSLYSHTMGRYVTGAIAYTHRPNWWQRVTRIFRKKHKHHNE
jgi:hypothetical protein